MIREAVVSAALLLSLPSARADEAFKKLTVDFDLAVMNINDRSELFSMGREHQTKVPYAVVGLAGEPESWLAFRLEVNGVNDSIKPEPFSPSAKTPFFFPNIADPNYGVSSSPLGQFKVDDYKNTGWDPYVEAQHLRRAFIDLHTEKRRFGLIAGRFFVPIGFQLEEFRWVTDKDLTHIQRINNQADAGAELYYCFGEGGALHGRLAGAVISGNGNPYHDYVYFDFTGSPPEDTNSAVGGVVSGRLSPKKGLELGLSYEFNYLGSRIESDTTVQRSKHYDNKLVASARYRDPRFRYAEVFGEYARYKWGLKDTSNQILPGGPEKSPIFKNGYYVGFDLGVPLPSTKGTVGIVVTREELDRDDSLVAYLASRNLLGVTLGKKERSTLFRAYADFGVVMAFFFYNDLKNPFPQASAIVPISGPQAFQTAGDSKVGFGIRFRTSLGF